MPTACTVCSHAALQHINGVLVSGAKSRRQLAKEYGLSEGSLARHRAHTLIAAAIVAQGAGGEALHGVRKGPAGAARAIEAILSGSALISEITRLRSSADRLGAQAEASGDARTALLAIRELTRL